MAKIVALDTGMAQNRVQTRMAVLKVWACNAFKRSHSRDVKGIVIDTLARHVLYHDRRDTNSFRDSVRVRYLCVLCLVLAHDFVHCGTGLIYDITQKLSVSKSGRHVHDLAKVDVSKAASKVLAAHQLQCL